LPIIYLLLGTPYTLLVTLKNPETLLLSYCYTPQGFGKSETPNAAFSAPRIVDDAIAPDAHW
jgi:hypothetical protein